MGIETVVYWAHSTAESSADRLVAPWADEKASKWVATTAMQRVDTKVDTKVVPRAEGRGGLRAVDLVGK